MRPIPSFVTAFASQLTEMQVAEPLFSRETYQFEVKEGKKRYFPFLQVSDGGELKDFFCTCKVSETGNGCPHLAAAYQAIFRHFEEPIHVRFKKSLWNRLFQMESKRFGYGSEMLKKKEDGEYLAEGLNHKVLISLTGKTPEAKKRLKTLIEERIEETEENSIKFSHFSSEEIAEYRAGRGNHTIRYELSLWSDLAKWVMYLQERKEAYQVLISKDANKIPHELRVEFATVDLLFYVSEANWPWLLPSLVGEPTSLPVIDHEENPFESVRYDPENKRLLLEVKQEARTEEGLEVGDWVYLGEKGFERRQAATLFPKEVPAKGIGDMLTRSGALLSRYLPIDLEPRSARYQLTIDVANRLQVELFLETAGDLESADLFPPWVYVPNKGFFLLQDLLFPTIAHVVPQEEVAAFVNVHRHWLHSFPGFQTHLGSLEAHLTYRFNEEGKLLFDAKIDFPQPEDEAIDFGEWIYLKGTGFYRKQGSRGRLPLHPGLTIEVQEISSFITAHKEELEQVEGFFSSELLLQKSGLKIGLNQEGRILIEPKLESSTAIAPEKLKRYGDYLFYEGHGFWEIPPAARLPERYRETLVIEPSHEGAFLTYELEPLRSFILEIDPRLEKPKDFRLKILKIERDRRKRKTEWQVQFVYESEAGNVDPFLIWEAFQEKKKHLFSPAGLISLKEPRLQWLRQIPKRRIDRKRGTIRLNMLEWIRLTVFEEVHPPKGMEPEAVKTRQIIEELERFESHRLLDISGLKSQLRPYQETGLQWLWFLYCHALSGLLCDDMGLGKTHQAMALLAAVSHEFGQEGKYLVVCPTSVIYHWQELLKRYLPHLRVCTYYGLERTLQSFETDYDLLLTSYGILRTGKEDLRSLSFEVAIFDEIQIAKNASSQTHRALRKIHATMRLGLTGTPIENRIQELKALYDLVLPGYMPQDAQFKELFIHPIEKHQDEGKKRLLSKLIRPFILRRKKSEVLFDLPEKIEEIAYCDLSPEQKELYMTHAHQLTQSLLPEIKDSSKPISYVHIFSALSRLKQICDHPCLVTGEIKKALQHHSGKWDLFVELLEEALGSGQKVVVFSQYLEMLEIIEQHLKKKGIPFATIKGSTRDRSEQLRRFREDPECMVFTASLLAAGVGIDLTVASIVIHYDRWWNPAKENQATDRVHRIGQNRGVQVFKLVTKNTIEERIHELIERKKGLLEDVVGQDEVDQVRFLSREELLEVFQMLHEHNP